MDFRRIDLPLVPFLPQISALLEGGRALVLTAEPGAGKSTLVPPYLMDAPWLGGRSIVMLEPRRLAASAIASRIAELLGEPVGRRAGYRVRSAARVSRETRIEVVTEALLTRKIQEDPLLEGVGLVIFDEFHERSLHADLALALALEVKRARPDLALLVMSATLDAGSVAALMGGEGSPPAPAIHCPGRSFPVQTRYRPLGAGGRWEDGFAVGVAQLFHDTEGDLLAFLPGAAEIRRVAGRLGGMLAGGAEILPLHGGLPLEDQQRIVRGGSLRRVILATSIAETSLTVPGVCCVADCGWARTSRYHPATGLDRLVTERVSASSAEQRRGRAGRLGPGLCVRFWKESEPLQASMDPEILRTDLSGLVLECALWGARTPDALRWLDPPPRSAWDRAGEVLRMLALVGDGGGPTALGRDVAALGLPPRLGVLAHEGASRGQRVLAAACAAILAERDGSGLANDPDLRLRLEILRSSPNVGDAPAEDRFGWRRAMAREIERILRRLPPVPRQTSAGWTAEQEERVGDLLALAFPDRVARKEPDGSYRFVTGRIARFPGSGPGGGALVPVASRASAEWIVAPEADAGETIGAIRLAAPVERAEAERALAAVSEEAVEVRWEGLVPKGFLVRRAGRLSLSERPVRPQRDAVASSFLERLGRQGLGILPWDEGSRSLLERMRFFAQQYPARGLGDMSIDGLALRVDGWLASFLRFSGGTVLTAERLRAALLGVFGGAVRDFEREAPEFLVLPTGGRRRIDYGGETPAVEARIQEVFGLAESPRVCGVPLAFRLLSPARRPLQITSDLAGFWRSTYAEVRREMRGRYPKHYWPENPQEARPTSGVRPTR